MVSILFLTVLASIILAVSTANLRMKQVEYRTKQNFYHNEQILSEVYNGIGKEATQCFSKAYASILSQVTKNDGTAVYEKEGDAYNAFSENFMNRIIKLFPEGAQNNDVLNRLNGYSLYAEIPIKVKEYERIDVIKESVSGGLSIPVQLIISGIKVNYKETDGAGNTTGFESTITTDIVIDVPYVTFFEDSSRALDYALIGNKGVYFNGGSRVVKGNVYAGTDMSEPAANMAVYRNEDVYGGLNFYGAETEIAGGYVVSKGDINVRKSRLTMAMDTGESSADMQIWAETMRTVENQSRNTPAEPSNVDVQGQIFLANDLELNARESQVKLKGEFYAYNNNRYETQEKKNLTGGSQTAGHTQSSSVIINGNNSGLDLTGLNTFVVAGTAYIDMANSNFSEGGAAGTEEYKTGESLALKANQYLYLAPPECLSGMNPSPAGEGEIKWAEGISWFAYNKGFINTVEPLTIKTYGRNGKKYNMYYLNFVDEGKKKEYAQLVLNMVEPDKMAAEMTPEILEEYEDYDQLELEQIWKVKEEIAGKVMADNVRSVIETADETTASIYAKGALTKVKDGKASVQIIEPDRKLSLDYVDKIEQNLLKHYQHMYVSLDPKEDFSLLSDALSSPDMALLTDETRPFSKYVNTALLFTGINETKEYRCSGKYGKCRTIISGGNYTVSGDISGIIICGGDVIIDNGVNVEGLVLAGGRIYINGGGSIEAGRAAVQAVLDEEYEEEISKGELEASNPAYASTYLKDYVPQRIGEKQADRVTGTDYTDYISYQNWKKGEAD